MRLNLLIAAVFIILARFINAGFYFRGLEIFGDFIIIGLLLYTLLKTFRSHERLNELVVWTGVGMLIVFFVVVPTIAGINFRHQLNPVLYVHDGPVQMEAAINFLEQGLNPYRENYLQTPLAEWSGGYVFGIENPALYHLIALPGHVLLSFLFHFPVQAVLGFYDERILYLIAYVIVLMLATRLGTTAVERLRSLILIGLNPLLVNLLTQGRNDILIFLFLLGSLLALDARRQTLSAALFAFALTTKMFAWVFFPLYVVVLIARSSEGDWIDRLRNSIVPLVVMLVIFTALMLPFVAWDAKALYDDIIAYPSGLSATSYPIVGGGFSTALVQLGIISSYTDYFPFWIFQALAAVPLLVLFLPRLAKTPKISLLVFSGTFLLFSVVFFSRFFNDNYFGLMLMLAAAALGFHYRETNQVKARSILE